MTLISPYALWLRAMPALFVVLWSTGFVGARLGLPYAEPLTFLAIRMLIASVLLFVFALLTHAPWPTKRDALHIAVAGLLVHAVYLGGVFISLDKGLAVGVTALIVGLQPLLTAVLAARLFAERVTMYQWIGLSLGLLGVYLVLLHRFDLRELSFSVLVFSGAALLGLTLGTLYQKRFCTRMDLRSGGVIQYGVCAVALGLGSFAFEQRDIVWSGEFIFALAWLVLVLSVGAVGLLYTLIRSGEVARVTSLFYLTPACAALFAYWLFDEQLGATAVLGMTITTCGVALVNVRKRA